MHDISIMNGWTPKRGHTQRGRERLRERIIFFRSAFRCEEVRGAAAHCEGKEWDWRMWASGTASPSDLLVAVMLAVSVACGRWHFNMPNCALAFASINEILLRKTEFQNDVRGVGALSLANITMSTACFPIMANSMAKFAFYIRGGRKNSSRIFPSPERPEAVALDKRWDKKKCSDDMLRILMVYFFCLFSTPWWTTVGHGGYGPISANITTRIFVVVIAVVTIHHSPSHLRIIIIIENIARSINLWRSDVI